jgi:hypothetical protein
MNMIRKSALALVLVTAAAGNAFADDPTIDPTSFISTASRAQVQADLQQHRQQSANPWSDDYDHLAGFRSERTRAEVSAEYIAERDAVTAMTGEDSGAMFMAKRDTMKSAPAHLAAAPTE